MATLSFHAGTEGKTQRKNINGSLNHMLRKTRDKYKNHGNPDIDVTRTEDNIDWTKDGRDVEELVDERLENEFKGKRTLRKDAVVLREIIIQASPDVFQGLSEAEKQQKAMQFTNDSLIWFGDEFGEQNIMAASVHMDETNPHTHVMIMPMTEDGRMSQKDFFRGPAGLARQHREYREHMNTLGWDFDLENKYGAVDSAKTPIFKANAQAIHEQRLEHKEMLDELQADPNVREEAEKAVYNDIFETVLMDEQLKLQEREKALKEREQALEVREQDVEEKERQQAERHEELFNRTYEVSGREHEVSKKERRLAEQGKKVTSVVLALLSGDERRKISRQKIEEQGALAFPTASIEKLVVGSLDDANKQKRQINTAKIKDDGLER